MRFSKIIGFVFKFKIEKDQNNRNYISLGKSRVYCIDKKIPIPASNFYQEGFWNKGPPEGLFYIWIGKEDEMPNHVKQELTEFKKCKKYEKDLAIKCNNVWCWNCYTLGHSSEKCKNPKKCAICREIGHTRYQCIHRQCDRCKRYGHYKKQCHIAQLL